MAKGVIEPLTDLPTGYTRDEIEPETLVLDTRFTSGLSPYINETFLKQAGRKGEKLIPFSLRPQAHDIIRTRLLYTTLQSYLRTGEIPFQNVMISGHVLAGKSEKISKSSGNTKVDPENLIKQRGADAVRYRSASGQLGKDMVFDEEELKKGQKLITKLRNAFQFVKMQLADAEIPTLLEQKIPLVATDEWILTKLNQTVQKMTKHLDHFEYGLAKIAFEEFFRKDFCDNYLELIKVRLYQPERFIQGQEKKKSGQQTLYKVFRTLLKLIAPYLPHISEEIYQDYFKESSHSIHKSHYPQYEETNPKAENLLSTMQSTLEIVEQVRRYKSEKQISMGAEITTLTISFTEQTKEAIAPYEDDLKGVTKAQNIKRVPGESLELTISE